MGWSYGINAEGREIGYGVAATCDQSGCDARINRGLGYACGGYHDHGSPAEDGTPARCGGYYCDQHRYTHERGPDGEPCPAYEAAEAEAT